MVGKFLKKNKKTIRMVSLWVGLLIVFGTHLAIFSEPLEASVQLGHATLNLVAGVLIALYAFWK